MYAEVKCHPPVLESLIPDMYEAEKAGRRPLLEHRRQYVGGPEGTQPHQTEEGALLLGASVGRSLTS